MTLKGLTSELSIIEAMNHPGLFGQWFPGESWDGWRALLKAAYALPMTEAEVAFFKTIAGDREPPKQRVKELWTVGGRRSGKDSVASLILGFSSALFTGQDKLRPGERATCLCLACDREQASIVLGYTKSYFANIPPLKDLVQRETVNGLELTNGVDVIVATNSYRSVRGRSILVAIFDEVSFWQDELTARPDTATYAAVTPGMATLPGAMLIGISTPHKKSGLLFSKWKQFFGQSDDRTLVIQAASTTLNPTLDPQIISQAVADDPASASAEWMAEWRSDLASFISTELLDACTDRGVLVRPPQPGLRYFAFGDPASGSGRDSFALGIAHAEGDKVVLDVAHEIRPPFSPTTAIEEVSALLKSYRVSMLRGDKFAAGFVTEGFARCGIKYEYSEHDRSEIYLEALPLLTSGRARLVDSKRLLAQFASLERRTMSTGRDVVDHPRGDRQHDDLCNACAGALAAASGRPRMVISREMLNEVIAAGPRHTFADTMRASRLRDAAGWGEAKYGERAWLQMQRRNRGL